MNKHYDIIILGLGSMGSATSYYTARKGKSVLALDQFHPPHRLGSHSGGSRIIRKAYFEHPDYVPLLNLAYTNWQELENIYNQKFFHKTGLIYFGKENELLINGVQRSANKYQIHLTEFSEEDLKQSYPQFNIPSEFTRLLEPDAGFIETDTTIEAYHTLAKNEGANLFTDTKVNDWDYQNNKITVYTEKGNFTAEKLILCAGAWTSALLRESGHVIKLNSTRQSFFWFEPDDTSNFIPHKFPCWNIQDPNYEGLFYGFPYKTEGNPNAPYGLKLAHHVAGKSANPDNLLEEPKQFEKETITKILDKYIPNTSKNLIAAGSCIYTNSSDEDFIIDYLDNTDKNVILACGFSGHGFKFVPAIGDLLSEMAISKVKAKELEFLSLSRF